MEKPSPSVDIDYVTRYPGRIPLSSQKFSIHTQQTGSPRTHAQPQGHKSSVTSVRTHSDPSHVLWRRGRLTQAPRRQPHPRQCRPSVCFFLKKLSSYTCTHRSVSSRSVCSVGAHVVARARTTSNFFIVPPDVHSSLAATITIPTIRCRNAL